MIDLLEWIKAGSTLIGGLGLALMYYQFRKAVRWNRVNATFTYLNNAAIMERERVAVEALGKLGFNLYQLNSPLDPGTVEKIRSSTHLFGEVKDFLNVFEGYATALNAGALDHDLAYNLRADRFIRYFQVFRPFIEKEREEMSNDMYWIEMQRVYKRWQPRREKERKKLARALEKKATQRRY